jgi:hypothetical protein
LEYSSALVCSPRPVQQYVHFQENKGRNSV